jgi:signal transduction histidine kinase
VQALTDAVALLHLHHIAQEAVHNAVRHGAPKRVLIRLSVNSHRIRLDVEDDGRGLAADWRRRSGLGISTMRYRAASAGGALAVSPRAPRGTCVSCAIWPRAKISPAGASAAGSG